MNKEALRSLAERLVIHQRTRGPTENTVVETKYMDTFTKARHFECGRSNDTEMGGSIRAVKGSKD